MYILTFIYLTLLHFAPDPTFQRLRTPTFPKETRLMYGGPTIADLNRDGFPDLLLCYHGSASIDIFYNDGTPSFTKQPFFLKRDNHAIVPAPGNSNNEMLFTVTIGGSFGANPNTPRLYSVKGGNITDVTTQRGIDAKGGRGRNALFLDMGASSLLDIIYTNAIPIDPKERPQFGYQNTGSKYRLRRLLGFDTESNDHIATTDIDGDGNVEIITFPTLKIFRRVADFSFVDITDDVVPPQVNRRGVVSVAELDYDNDGDFDLFIARTNTGALGWVRTSHFDDYLLENRGGKYVDVSRSAKLPRGLGSRGVTVADFNNDGYVDIFISRFFQKDLLLMNARNKVFRAVPHNISRPGNVHGDHAQAVDLNADGFVDLVVSQGSQHDINHGGSYKVYLNRTPKGQLTGFVEVCVGRSPKGRSAMHALVKLQVMGITMVRRVGDVGVVHARSYLDCVHFGVAVAAIVDLEVRWVGGEVVRRKSVPAGKRTRVGSF